MRTLTLLLALAPATALADVAPTPDCGCATGADPVATGLVLAALALLVLRRRAG